jgi:phosphoribosylanthranilate isomerase
MSSVVAGPDHRLLIKVCGLTDPGEARAVAEAGADWIGLNFHPPSPRYVTERRAAEILAALPASVEAVGLFVNRPPDEVIAVADRLGLGIVQLHGDEPPEDLPLREGLAVIRAFRIGSTHHLDAMLAHLDRAAELGRTPDAALIDARVAGLYGGTGLGVESRLLDLLAPLARRLPPLILSGGLTPENVAERVARCRPRVVDVAGGVESSPGRKDPARVAAFVEAARGAMLPPGNGR